eukprot:11114835-Ditylum_brightwellii.AAC.1
MATALEQIGATQETVDIDKFANDLRTVFEELDKIETELVVAASPDGTQVSAGMAVNEAQLNRIILDIVRVGDTYGIKFPREFGLLLKQILYFDKYVQILAPGLEVMNDERINLPQQPGDDDWRAGSYTVA